MNRTLWKNKFLLLFFAASIEMVVSIIVFLSDTVIAGYAVGETGISAMNIMSPIVSFTIFISCLIATGVAYSYNSAIGKADKKHADGLFGMGIMLSAGLSVLVFIIITLFRDLYFEFLNPNINILKHSHDYYSYYKYVILTDPLITLFTTMIYNDGDELLSSVSDIVQIIVNIACSLFFAIVLDMGLKGIALGTLVKNIVSAIILSFHFFSKSNSLKPEIYFSFRDLWEICKNGFVDVGHYLTIGVLSFILSKFVIIKFGDIFLPVLSIALNLLELPAVFVGIAEAASPLISVYYYEKNYPAVRKVMNIAMKFLMFEGIIFSVILFIFAEYVPSAFNIEEPELVKHSVYALRIISSTFAFLSVFCLWESYYIIQRKNMIVMISLFLRSLIFIPLLAIPLGLFFGLNGVWLGFAFTPILALIVCSLIICMKYGRESFPYYLDDKNNIADFDVVLTPANVIKLRDDAEKFLSERSIPSKTINKIMLIIEETGMTIIEQNKGKKILSEYTIEIIKSHSVRLIVRDNGKIFDITDKNSQIKSFRNYFFAQLMSMKKLKDNENMTVISNNRNIFTIPLS
ncbi:MAG: hypothetical protein IJP69_11450 [Synergistaceae bacterium]|nr:hypothetical protein [Synergistaceae bacterium]